MRYTDKAFAAFCDYYNKEDFDGAAKILYEAVTRAMKHIQLNPLVKTDISYALEQLAQKHVDIPTPGLFRQTITEMARYLESARDVDMREALN